MYVGGIFDSGALVCSRPKKSHGSVEENSEVRRVLTHLLPSDYFRIPHNALFFILLFCKICFLYLTVTPSASRSLSKCRLHGFKMETLNSVHYLTNLRSSLLVTSRISCYEVACARLSESRDAAKIKQAKRK